MSLKKCLQIIVFPIIWTNDTANYVGATQSHLDHLILNRENIKRDYASLRILFYRYGAVS